MSLAPFASFGHAPRGRTMADADVRRCRAATLRFARASLATLSLVCVMVPAQAVADESGNYNAAALRAYVAARVGGLQKLQVPARNEDLPLPRQPDGTVNPRYATTEAKRYLGKLLFHDPVRTVRINKNTGQPVDLPAGTAFGGTENASNPNIKDVVDATRQTGSCGSCHIGEAAGKAGQVLNFNVACAAERTRKAA